MANALTPRVCFVQRGQEVVLLLVGEVLRQAGDHVIELGAEVLQVAHVAGCAAADQRLEAGERLSDHAVFGPQTVDRRGEVRELLLESGERAVLADVMHLQPVAVGQAVLSPRRPEASGLSTDDAVRALLLLMPRLVGRAKRLRIPDELQSLALAPRHLSLLSYLLFDGPMTVNDLAARLKVAPTTVSLMVGDLSRKGILERREDSSDHRRRIISITGKSQSAIHS